MAQVRLEGAATARPAPGSAISPPWNPARCGCGGPHLIAPHGSEGYRCIAFGRTANHKRARYALKHLPCAGRCGLGWAPRPCRPRLKWNRTNEARWRRQGEGGHQAVRYNSAQHDGRWLCMRCGLHYVRFCDLRAKRCAGAPAGQAATQAIAVALAGGPLTRRKVHAFAKHPSGSRPGAPGARLPSDRLVLDPSVLRPLGPAAPQAQEQVADAGPEAPMAHVAASHLSPAHDEAHGEPRAVAEGPASAIAKRQRSGEANREEGRGEGIRAFLVLGPSGVEPGSRARPAVDVGRGGKPVKPKTRPAQGGPTGRKPRKPRTLPELPRVARGHIHR